jgi:hypothetical protein
MYESPSAQKFQALGSAQKLLQVTLVTCSYVRSPINYYFIIGGS